MDNKYNGSLGRALDDNNTEYLIYFITFLVISLLWFVHHSLFNFIKKLNPLMFLTHQCSLSFVGVVPTAIKVFADSFRSSTSDADKATAIQVATTIIAIVSLLQFLLLVLMTFADDECVDKTLFNAESSLLLLVKVTIIPTSSVIGYWCSMGSENIQRYSFYVLHIITPLAFVLTNILIKSTKLHAFCQHCWEKLQSMCCKQSQQDCNHTI